VLKLFIDAHAATQCKSPHKSAPQPSFRFSITMRQSRIVLNFFAAVEMIAVTAPFEQN
jgi:hypothetical protein